MTTFSYKQIIADARVALGHNDVSSSISQMMNTIDQLTFDEVIRRSIIPSARQLLMVAPKEKVEWQILEDYTPAYSSNCISVPLPANYLRVGSAKLNSWAYPVNVATLIDTVEYHAQFSEYDGLKATPRHPMMAIVEGVVKVGETMKNCMMLQMFGTRSGDSVQYVTYVGEPVKKDIQLHTDEETNPGEEGPIEQDAPAIQYALGAVEEDTREPDEKVGIEYSQYLYWPLVFMVASSVAKTLKDTNTGAVMLQTCNDLMTDRENLIAESVAAARNQQSEQP